MRFILLMVPLICSAAFGQVTNVKFQVAADSSYVILPGVPKPVITKRVVSGNKVYYQISGKHFRSWVSTSDMFQKVFDLNHESLEACRRNDSIHSNEVETHKELLKAEKQRSLMFQTEMETLKSASLKCDSELSKCSADLRTLNTASRKKRSSSFLKGGAIGIGAGLIVGLLLGGS